MKHTKGPWEVKHSESKNAFNVVGTVLGGNYKIARCPYPVYDFAGAVDRNQRERDEAEANAKLIATAPDMLKALQSAYEYLSQNCYQDKEHWKEVEFAISKATS